MNRQASLEAVRNHRDPWDLVVIGGGATGVGIALDAASRGYSVALFEQSDFGKGTSSRSTKLIHGGVRYLAQGDIGLVREALYERALLLRNAPAYVRELAFVIPATSYVEALWYRAGIGVYDMLAGSERIGRSALLSGRAVRDALPGIRAQAFDAGVLFHDGQFDDARLLIGIARTAAAHGAVLLNYAPVTGFLRSGAGKIAGVRVLDQDVPARAVINATGAFADQIRGLEGNHPRRLAISRGSHVVVDGSFLPSKNALLIPKTPDGRVLFAIPWLSHTLLGTTDVEIEGAPLDPVASSEDIDFILDTASSYLARKPRREDVLSAWAGIRPLVRKENVDSSARLSRDHSIFEDPDGLVTIVGGKWTTYRHMAEQCVDLVARNAGLEARKSGTAAIPIAAPEPFPPDGRLLDPSMPYETADVRRAVRTEMAVTLEDVLARRTRMLFLNASAALDAAPVAARTMAGELGWDEDRIESELGDFRAIAAGFQTAR
jgi:glycerol-3-phosphate dehydrogenase